VDPTACFSRFVIARIVRTRGIRGEVLAELHTDFPERFSSLDSVWLEFPKGNLERLALESFWPHKGRMVLKFRGIDTIDGAGRLVGAWVEIEAGEAAPLPEGTYWDHDLIGCVLSDGKGKKLGEVTAVLRIAGNCQLVIRGERGEFLVPAVSGICREISIERREIVVDLPEGLMDLNS
jgi:16S rRNA processing protein RimM